MKLELNTNGSWRTVLRGLGGHDPSTLNSAKEAAQRLAAIDSGLSRKPHSWRLVSEANDKVLERCTGSEGWVDAAPMEYAR